VRLLRDDYRLPDSVVASGQLRNIPVAGLLVAVSGVARFRPPGRTRLYISTLAGLNRRVPVRDSPGSTVLPKEEADRSPCPAVGKGSWKRTARSRNDP
jgi:hypothetical protein